MCLVIHKPAKVDVPLPLLESAADFNPHGFGIMSLDGDRQLLVRRRSVTNKKELHRLYAQVRAHECVIHLRYGTSGKVDIGNTHPIRITRHIYMVHNGTMNIQRHLPARSDTWHLVHDYLRPILSRRPELLHDRFFQDMVLSWCGPHNRFVFMDAEAGRTVIVNRDKGFEVEGLWVSNTRWFDASIFPWHRAATAAAGQTPQALFTT